MDLLKKIVQKKDKLKADFSYVLTKKNEVIGFSLAEMAIVMLILSIVMAVAAPIITKRKLSTQANDFPAGTIAIWSGLIDATHTPPTGWALCDGKNGTPDLQDRFILAAGTHDVGTACDPTIPTDPTKNPECSEDKYILQANQLPAHSHTGTTNNNSAAHNHGITYASTSGGIYVYYVGGNSSVNGLTTTTYSTAYPSYYNSKPHKHDFKVDDNVHAPAAEGRGNPYKNMPPYYVLAYIIKLR